jgi:DNA-binding GntR family transcriptional regulator
MFTVNANDPRPPYVQIADELRRAIRAGETKPGERVQSGRELAKRFGVAAMTVHNALNLLKDEGLLVSWQGRGVFVADPLPDAEANLGAEVRTLRGEVAELRERVTALEKKRR